MLYVEYAWAKRSGLAPRKRVRVGYRAIFVHGHSMSSFVRGKIEQFPEEHKPYQWFQIMLFDNLSNIAENSPRSTARLRWAQSQCRQMRPSFRTRLT